jgi:hypothetical protein
MPNASSNAQNADPSAFIGQRVRLHVNLRRGDLVLTDIDTKRVIAYTGSATLTDVTFIVRESTRRRIVEQGSREVCAWAVGTLVDLESTPTEQAVTFNPFKAPTFVHADEPIHSADRVRFVNRRGYLV